MANIASVSRLEENGQAMLAAMMQVAPIFRGIEFRPDTSTRLQIPDKSTHSNSAARAEGSDAQRDDQVPNPVSRSLALYTREIAIDEVRLMDVNVGMSPAGLRQFATRQQMALAKKLAVEVQNDMAAGTATSNTMLGLANFIKDANAAGQTAALGFTTAEQAAMLTQVSLQLNTSANQATFAEQLETEIAKVPGANLILCNHNLSARLNTIGISRAGSAERRELFGVPFATFAGVPIIALPTGAIPQTESDGSNSDCTSLYILRTDENGGVCFSTNSGFLFKDFDVVDEHPDGVSRMSFYIDLTVERTDAVRRLSRIRL